MKHYPAPHADDPHRIERIEALVKNKDAAIDRQYLQRVKDSLKKQRKGAK